jgi:SAM-dependent MidA family methyltransferase
MTAALYGPDGFFVRADDGPAGHFRTSVHASPLFAGALLRLVERIDEALGRPKNFDLVDVGAGRGELLTTLRALLPADLAGRVRLVGVELAPRPGGLDPAIGWRPDVPDGVTGLLVATEWLDNVPLDIAERDDAGQLRKILVDPASGEESLGTPIDAADRFWLERWWPHARLAESRSPHAGRAHSEPPHAGRTESEWVPAGRVEVGWPRDAAWAEAVGRVARGCALAVDYGHLREGRPALGTLAGYRDGRQVVPVPDGSCDVTAHVAVDAVASAAGIPYEIVAQREALKALGVDGARPPLELARRDPGGYVRALSRAGAAAELIEPGGLGGHWWLLHTVGIDPRGSMLL